MKKEKTEVQDGEPLLGGAELAAIAELKQKRAEATKFFSLAHKIAASGAIKPETLADIKQATISIKNGIDATLIELGG